MSDLQNIRNLSVIAHVDHGKSTLTDTLIKRAGVSSKERYTDDREDEAMRGISIKATGVSLSFSLAPSLNHCTEGNTELLVNLIDSPGHVDFSSEVTAALRLSDGTLVVVDCIEGVRVQTETVLRQALEERVKPVLVLNKMDRIFLELKKSPEECYQTFLRIVESVNVLIAQYSSSPEEAEELSVDPLKGTVIFGSGLHGWGFSVRDFALMFAPKFGVSPAELTPHLWGEHYYDGKSKEWLGTPRTRKGKPLRRGFVEYVLSPIYKLFDALMSDRTTAHANLAALGVVLKGEQKELTGKPLYKTAMPLWLPMADAALQLITEHLPNPVQAQRRRVEAVYNGDRNDKCGRSISACDPSGPLVAYVAKMVPASGAPGRFFAYARIFSGTLVVGDKVTVLGPNYVAGETHDMFTGKTIQRVVKVSGKKVSSVDQAVCGNVVGIFGLDNCLVTTGTLTTTKECAGIKTMKFSVSPVVQAAVSAKTKTEVAKLVDGLRRLVKTDNCVRCFEQDGQHIVAATGELHLEIVLSDLRTLAGIDIEVSEPAVSYRETVIAPSSFCCLAKSANKHNRIWSTAEPLGEGLAAAIEAGDVRPDQSSKERTRILRDGYAWSQAECKRFWSLGPEGDGPNALVDDTKQVHYVHDVRDTVCNGFGLVCSAGVLCEEPLRGVRFDITDGKFHSQGLHRSANQIVPAVRQSFCAAMLAASPALLEPMFSVEIMCPHAAIGGVYSTLRMRRGRVTGQEQKADSPQYVIHAFLPVSESFGFNAALQSNTGGQAFPLCTFDHWALVEGDVLDASTRAGKLVLEIRRRKGLPEALPCLESFLDKIGAPPPNPRLNLPPPPAERVVGVVQSAAVPVPDAGEDEDEDEEVEVVQSGALPAVPDAGEEDPAIRVPMEGQAQVVQAPAVPVAAAAEDMHAVPVAEVGEDMHAVPVAEEGEEQVPATEKEKEQAPTWPLQQPEGRPKRAAEDSSDDPHPKRARREDDDVPAVHKKRRRKRNKATNNRKRIAKRIALSKMAPHSG